MPDFFSSGYWLLTVICLTFSVSSAYAQNTYKNEFGFRSDNDAYLAVKQDRYYTNGLFISFRHATDQQKLGEKLNKLIWEAEVGQKMYTSYSAKVNRVGKIDRPFAAYLYAGAAVNLLYHSENSLKLSLQVGTIGPSAGGEDVQVAMHELLDFYDIEGWDTQVENETGINSRLEFTSLIKRSTSSVSDIAFSGYANLGTTFSGLGAGVLIRLGSLNPFYQSVSTGSRISHNASELERPAKEFFFYLRPSLNLVAYDATIQGGMFSKSKGPYTFDIKPLVFSQDIGLNYSRNRFTGTFNITFNSREVKSTARGHQYGTITMYYRFN